MIVTITINPALDKSASVDKLIPEKKLRCSGVDLDAGGGGVNVSKAIKKLGSESLALITSGGHNGKRLEEILFNAGIRFQALHVKSETRENFTVVEGSTNSQYRFVLPGDALLDAEVKEFLSQLRELKPRPELIVASGSLPKGVDDRFYANLARMAKDQQIPLIVDTSGEPLLKAAREGVFLLKPNLSELCSMIGKDYLELNEIDQAARQVLDNGQCEVLVVSRGAAGALLVTKDLHEYIAAPTVKKVSAVGAGDSMVGGMAWMLQQGESLDDVVRFGVACGTAATMNPGTRLFNREDAFRLYEWMKNPAV